MGNCGVWRYHVGLERQGTRYALVTCTGLANAINSATVLARRYPETRYWQDTDDDETVEPAGIPGMSREEAGSLRDTVNYIRKYYAG